MSLSKTDTKHRLRMTSPRPSQRQQESDTQNYKREIRRSISFEIQPIAITPIETKVPRSRQSKHKKPKKSIEESTVKEKFKEKGNMETSGEQDSLKKKNHHTELELVGTPEISLSIDLVKTEKGRKSKRYKATQDGEVENNEDTDTHKVKSLLLEKRTKNDKETERRERKSSTTRIQKNEEEFPPLNLSSPASSPNNTLLSPLPIYVQKKKTESTIDPKKTNL